MRKPGSKSRLSLAPPIAENGHARETRQPLTRAEAEFAKELFETHRLSLYRYLNGLLNSRQEASELLQETYLRLLRQPDFDRVHSNIRAYLFQTATNLARDLFRQRASKGIGAELAAFAAAGMHTPDWTGWPDLALEGEQVGAIIIAALEELDQPVRLSLLLHRFRDFTHRQIAVCMGVSERTVERHITKGLTHIAARLKAEL
jgi:RNA polymerase sigma-70 factor (ECF subfamily)